MSVERNARVRWEGDLAKGAGLVTAASSLAFQDLRVSWPARTTAQNRTTTPEELIAAAHASCFAMALSHAIARAGLAPGHLDVTATVRFAEVDGTWTIVASHLDVVCAIAGADERELARIAHDAKEGCPVSRALRGNVEITVEATLSSDEMAYAAGP